MNNTDFQITEILPEDKPLVTAFISENWGSPMIVTRGRIYDSAELSGFVFKSNDIIIGLITYTIENNECIILTLDSKTENKGLGTSLLNKVRDHATEKGCQRTWLTTTNDNTRAIRFYQKRGFEWIGYYPNAMIESRKLKPEIPVFGFDNIPIKHELEFEMRLG